MARWTHIAGPPSRRDIRRPCHPLRSPGPDARIPPGDLPWRIWRRHRPPDSETRAAPSRRRILRARRRRCPIKTLLPRAVRHRRRRFDRAAHPGFPAVVRAPDGRSPRRAPSVADPAPRSPRRPCNPSHFAVQPCVTAFPVAARPGPIHPSLTHDARWWRCSSRAAVAVA